MAYGHKLSFITMFSKTAEYCRRAACSLLGVLPYVFLMEVE
jgi:hypothetical protein